jgi:hypothetical protein
MPAHSWFARAFATIEDAAYAAEPSTERTARSALHPDERFPRGAPPPEIWPGMTAADYDAYHRHIEQHQASKAAAVAETSAAAVAAAAAATAGCEDDNENVESCSSVAAAVQHDRVAPPAPKKARHSLSQQHSQKHNAAASSAAAEGADIDDSVPSQCSASASNYYMLSHLEGLPSQLGFSQIDHDNNSNPCSHSKVQPIHRFAHLNADIMLACWCLQLCCM